MTKQILRLGKIDYDEKGRNVNSVELKLEIETLDYSKTNWDTMEKVVDPVAVSICGNIWNSNHPDIVCGGQNIEEIMLLIKTPKVRRIWEIWSEYHLNDLQAGTKVQTEALKAWSGYKENVFDYVNECEFLKSIDLYEDRGYQYGHGWLFKPVPESIVKELLELFS